MGRSRCYHIAAYPGSLIGKQNVAVRIPLEVVALTVLIIRLCSGDALAAGQDQSNSPEESVREDVEAELYSDQWSTLEAAKPFAEDVEGYQPRGRIIGTPIDVETDLNRSFPQTGSILPRVIPEGWFNWKEDLNEKYGFKLSLSYQSIYQRVPSLETRTGVNAAWGGWALLEAQWTLLNRDQDYEGSLVATLDYRHDLGGKLSPLPWGLFEVGSQWPTDPSIVEWDPWTPILYWEQWLTQDRFVMRAGNQNVLATLDFMRYKDPRVAFSGGPHTVPSHVMPHPGPGFSAMFEWWPIEGSKLYVVGTLNDQNFEIEKLTWDDALSKGDFFYALEVGNNWGREVGFDHLHATLFYGDARAEAAIPGTPNEAGWGFKVYGEKQMGRIVGYGGYTYNTAEGGPFGITVAKHSVTAGVGLAKPFGIGGEFNVGTAWAQPINDTLRSQFSLEAYWKMLLFPSAWLTPGVQFIFDPTLNPEQDQISIAQVKFRVFF